MPKIPAICERWVGSDHLQTAKVFNDVAKFHRLNQQYDEAEKLHQKALDIREEKLGLKDEKTIESRYDLAVLYGEMERYTEAELLFSELLTKHGQQLGSGHPIVLGSLTRLAVIDRHKGQYRAAISKFKKVLTIYEENTNIDNSEIDVLRNNLAVLYTDVGQYSEAETLYKELLDDSERKLGLNHPSTGLRYNNLGLLYFEQGRYSDANTFFLKALSIYSVLLKSASPQDTNNIGIRIATFQNNLAVLYGNWGRYIEAQNLHQQALSTRERLLNIEHPQILESRNNLAILYSSRGRYAEAKELYQNVLTSCKHSLGPNHPFTAQCLNNIALNNWEMGEYDEALALYRQALYIREQQLGYNHPKTIESLHNLSTLYMAIGQYNESEALYLRIRSIHEQLLDFHHPQIAQTLNNLAVLYLELERYEEVLSLLEQALAIRKEQLGLDHPKTAESIYNLASLYSFIGRNNEVEPLLQQAKDIYEHSLGSKHPETTQVTSALAILYAEQGLYNKASELHQQALAIREEQLGLGHPKTAESLYNLALLHLRQQLFTNAENLLKRTLAIEEEKLGSEHPKIVNTLSALALLYWKTGLYSKALTSLERAGRIESKGLGQFFAASTDAQRLMYLRRRKEKLDILLSLVSQHVTDLEDGITIAFRQVLHRKVLGTEASTLYQKEVLSEQYPHLNSELNQYKQLSQKIEKLKLIIPEKLEQFEAYRNNIDFFERQIDSLEREICRQIPEMNLQKIINEIDILGLSQALPPQSILIEFVCFNFLDSDRIFPDSELNSQSLQYCAFILEAGHPQHLYFINLGDAKSINENVRNFCEALSASEYTSRVVFPSDIEDNIVPSFQNSNQIGQILYKQLIAPLEVYLTPKQQIFIAPDGELSRLPFQILPGQKQSYLMQEYALRYIASGRDLIRFSAANNSIQATLPLVLADPDFDSTTNQNIAISQAIPLSLAERDRFVNNFHRSCIHGFSPLPGTRIEGEKVAAKLGVTPYLKGDALKSHISQSRSPYILHMATHGYVLENLPEDDFSTTITGLIEQLGAFETSDLFKRLGPFRTCLILNRSMRSGLAFAGANRLFRSETKALPSITRNSLLTAQDTLGLNLLATQLVVASACQTALGDVMVGEGVLGLRRAFILAGAQTLVLSLWKVDDIATAILMERFYDNLLGARMGRAEALEQAQYYLRDLTVGQIRALCPIPKKVDSGQTQSSLMGDFLERLSARPSDYKPFEFPKYWGGFICQGNPAPLPNLESVLGEKYWGTVQ